MFLCVHKTWYPWVPRSKREKRWLVLSKWRYTHYNFGDYNAAALYGRSLVLLGIQTSYSVRCGLGYFVYSTRHRSGQKVKGGISRTDRRDASHREHAIRCHLFSMRCPTNTVIFLLFGQHVSLSERFVFSSYARVTKNGAPSQVMKSQN